MTNNINKSDYVKGMKEYMKFFGMYKDQLEKENFTMKYEKNTNGILIDNTDNFVEIENVPEL